MQPSIALLEALTQADGAPGFEEEVREIFTQRLASAGEIRKDRMGGVICAKRGSSDRPRVMLDCHLDEVGFVVQHVTSSGFLKFLPLGSWWGHILPAQRVRVVGSNGKLVGVIGSTPPHFLPADQRGQVLDVREMFVDIGAKSRQEAEEWGVRPGAWAVPWGPFTRLRNDHLLLSKAFDNRVGCALCIEATERITGHPGTLYACGSVQEEIGLRGARLTAAMVDPDVAIVLEGPPADDTPGFAPDERQGVLGGGVQIRAYDPTMIANPRLVELALRTAREAGIPHQVTVRAGGGTDGGAIHMHGHGVPTVVLGVPARYIHSHTSIICIDDYLAALQLTTELVKRLDPGAVASL